MSVWAVLLVAATALHAGFQLTVTMLVYPALAGTAPDRFADAHDRHSRRILPLVLVVYGFLVVAAVGALVSTPADPWVWTAAAAGTASVLVTAVRAAPLHTELGRQGPGPTLLASLIAADRLRTAAALLAAASATVSAMVGP